MEIDNVIFQDVEVLEKKNCFKLAVEKFWILFGKILEYYEMVITQCRIKCCICYVCIF